MNLLLGLVVVALVASTESASLEPDNDNEHSETIKINLAQAVVDDVNLIENLTNIIRTADDIVHRGAEAIQRLVSNVEERDVLQNLPNIGGLPGLPSIGSEIVKIEDLENEATHELEKRNVLDDMVHPEHGTDVISGGLPHISGSPGLPILSLIEQLIDAPDADAVSSLLNTAAQGLGDLTNGALRAFKKRNLAGNLAIIPRVGTHLINTGIPGLPDLGGIHALPKIGQNLLNTYDNMPGILPSLKKRNAQTRAHTRPAHNPERVTITVPTIRPTIPHSSGASASGSPVVRKRDHDSSVDSSEYDVLSDIIREGELLVNEVIPNFIKQASEGNDNELSAEDFFRKRDLGSSLIAKRDIGSNHRPPANTWPLTFFKRDTAGSSASGLHGISIRDSSPVEGPQSGEAASKDNDEELSAEDKIFRKRDLSSSVIEEANDLFAPGIQILEDISDGLNRLLLPFLHSKRNVD